MGGDTNDRDYHIVLSVLSRDKNGNPAVIIGTKKDVTEEQQLKRLDEERTLRYWSIFYTPILGIILFNKDGRLVNINPKACDIFGCNAEETIEEGIDIHSMFNIDIQDLEDMDGYQATQTVSDDMITEFRLMTIHDDAGEMLGVFAFCRDKSRRRLTHCTTSSGNMTRFSTPPSVIPTSAKSPTHQTPTR